jgi:hypothetical protein
MMILEAIELELFIALRNGPALRSVWTPAGRIFLDCWADPAT